MAKQAIWVMLKAKPGKDAEIEDFLKAAATMAAAESGTVTWYGVRTGLGVYGIFDTFDDEAGRDAHLQGDVAKTLMSKAPELFSNDIRIERMEILASK